MERQWGENTQFLLVQFEYCSEIAVWKINLKH